MALPEGTTLTIDFGSGAQTIAKVHNMTGVNPIVEMLEDGALDDTGNVIPQVAGRHTPGEFTCAGKLIAVANLDSIIAARDANTLVTVVVEYNLGYTTSEPTSTFTGYITSFQRPVEKGTPMVWELVIGIAGAVTEAAGVSA